MTNCSHICASGTPFSALPPPSISSNIAGSSSCSSSGSASSVMLSSASLFSTISAEIVITGSCCSLRISAGSFTFRLRPLLVTPLPFWSVAFRPLPPLSGQVLASCPSSLHNEQRLSRCWRTCGSHASAKISGLSPCVKESNYDVEYGFSKGNIDDNSYQIISSVNAKSIRSCYGVCIVNHCFRINCIAKFFAVSTLLAGYLLLSVTKFL